MDDVARIIKDYVVREFMDSGRGGSLADDAPLIEDGVIDSLGIFVLVAFLEKEFGVKIRPDDILLENFETVGAIRDLVLARRPAGPAAS